MLVHSAPGYGCRMCVGLYRYKCIGWDVGPSEGMYRGVWI